jgi:hypothetical protein
MTYESQRPNEVQPNMSGEIDFFDKDHPSNLLPPLPLNFSKNNRNITNNKMFKIEKKLKKL